MRYTRNIRYLVPSIMYLGTNAGWWARSPSNLCVELSLDRDRLKHVFDEFPEVFRKSRILDKQTGEAYYSLQARYAKREGSKIDQEERFMDVAPLPTEHLKLVLDFVIQMAEAERVGQRAALSSIISVSAAVVAAIAAIVAAGLKVSAG